MIHTISLLFIIQIAYSQQTVSLSDFEILHETNWQGYLTYKDFSSGETKFVDAIMQILIKDEKIITNLQYIYEPNKNESSKVSIKDNGRYFGSEEVLSNSFENGIRTIVTKYEGKDNGKPALQYKTYRFDNQSFSKTKEVQYVGSEERFIRNAYHFKIKN